MHIISKNNTAHSTRSSWTLRNIILSIFSLSLAATLVSCGAKSAVYNTKASKTTADYAYADRAVETEMAVEMPMAAMDMEDSYLMDESIAGNGTATPTAPAERKLIKTGNISIEVQSLKESEQALNQFVAEMGGYITNTWSYTNSFNATIKIPADRFEEAMTKAGTLGKTRNRNTNTEDVTDQYFDLKTRIETKITMQQKFQEYLKKADDIKDLLEIERQLNSVTTDIEIMQGQFNRLANQISYSTITVSMELPFGQDDHGFEWPDMGEKFRQFGTNFVDFMAWLLMAFFYIIVFGIPLVALLALFYWILFGKIGLLRKLFSKIRVKSKSDKDKQ